MCIITLLVGWFVLSPTELRDLTTSVSAATAYMSNIRFAHSATNYLADDARADPVLHTWSLAVEEQFYLVWPLLIAAVMRWRSGIPASEVRQRARTIGVVGVLSTLSLILCVRLTASNEAWAFFGSPTRAWEFGTGALGMLLQQSILNDRRWRAHVFALGGMAAIIVSAVLYTTSTVFPGIAAALPVLGTAAILISGTVPTQGPVERFLRLPIMQWLGRLSYSWYLWHWPVLTYTWILHPTWGVGPRVVAVLIALAIAFVSNVVVEQPIRYNRFFAQRPKLSVASALTLTVAGVCCALVVRKAAIYEARTPNQIAYTRARADAPRVDGTGCTLGFWAVDQPRPCTFGDTTSDTTIVLFGDSHAGHWFPAFERVALDRHWKLVTLLKSACPTMDVPIAYEKLGRAYTECSRWRSIMLQRIRVLKPAAVVMSNSSYYVARDGDSLSEWTVSAASWRTGTHRSVEALTQSHIPVLIVQDVFRPDFNVPKCLARKAWSVLWRSSTCTFNRDNSLNEAAIRSEREAVAGVKQAAVFDPNSIICHTAVCPSMIGKTVLYKDSNHLTGTFSARFAGVLSRQLDTLLGQKSSPTETAAAPRTPDPGHEHAL
jgi:peptidoglycan/LPS O-acetylase OafA/YrhL